MPENLYFAYGSNINLDQMAQRCPNAEPLGAVVLNGYELQFRGNSRGAGVATIAPKRGAKVYGLLWNITEKCEASLDIYEGYPRLYTKKQVSVWDKQGNKLSVMAYVMTEEYSKNPTMPSYYYYEGIKEGFWQNGLPVAALGRALKRTQEEVKVIEGGKPLPETNKAKKKKRNNPER